MFVFCPQFAHFAMVASSGHQLTGYLILFGFTSPSYLKRAFRALHLSHGSLVIESFFAASVTVCPQSSAGLFPFLWSALYR
jgi:hypothetical protein